MIAFPVKYHEVRFPWYVWKSLHLAAWTPADASRQTNGVLTILARIFESL